MKLFIILAVFSVAVFARPNGQHPPALSITDIHPEYAMYAVNIIQDKVKEEPMAEPDGKEGSVTFLGPDGNWYTVDYIADFNGFRPNTVIKPATPEMVPVV